MSDEYRVVQDDERPLLEELELERSRHCLRVAAFLVIMIPAVVFGLSFVVALAIARIWHR